MANLAQMLKDLRNERTRVAREMNRLDKAISALGKLAGRSAAPAAARRGAPAALKPRKRRKVTAATRRKIAEAQKARWAKVRKEKAA
jgi:hypothetical protein